MRLFESHAACKLFPIPSWLILVEAMERRYLRKQFALVRHWSMHFALVLPPSSWVLPSSPRFFASGSCSPMSDSNVQVFNRDIPWTEFYSQFPHFVKSQRISISRPSVATRGSPSRSELAEPVRAILVQIRTSHLPSGLRRSFSPRPELLRSCRI
jgi:hypothetical protein